MAVCDKHGDFTFLCRGCHVDTEITKDIHKEQHYKFIEKYGECFAKGLNHPHVTNINDYVVGDGDKCYSYRDEWFNARVPFPIGVMIYMTSKIHPFSEHVRETRNGWVAPAQWVISIYHDMYLDNNRDRKKNHPLFGVFYYAINNVVEQYRKDQKEKQNDSIPGTVS